MSSPEIACNRIRKLIANGKLEYALDEITRLSEHSSFISDAIQQQARFTYLKQKIRSGTLNWDDESISRNQITASALDLLDLWLKSGEKNLWSRAGIPSTIKYPSKPFKGLHLENGVNAERLSYEGFGESQPIATNFTSQGRKLNRRVEFELYLE